MQVKDSIKSLMDAPYPADPITEEEFIGMTYGEVAYFRQVQKAAAGSKDSLEMLLDRTVGKPIQTNQNISVGMTYMDFLNKVAAEEGEVIDVTPAAKRQSEEIT